MKRSKYYDILLENIFGLGLICLVLIFVFLAFFYSPFDNLSLKLSTNEATTENTKDKKNEIAMPVDSISTADIDNMYKQVADNEQKKIQEQKRIAEKKALLEKQARDKLEREKAAELAKKQAEEKATKEKIEKEKAAALAKKQAEEKAAKEKIEKEKAAALAKKQAEEKATKEKIEREKAAALAKKQAEEKAAKEKIEKEKAAALAKKQAEEKAAKEKIEKEKAAALAKKQAEEKAAKEKIEKEKAAALAKKQAEEKAMADAKAKAEKQKLLDSINAGIEERQKKNERDAAIARYSKLIQETTQKNWAIPPKLPDGLQVKLRVTALISGAVTNVDVVKSSGNIAFDNSAIEAVKRASPLPFPDNPEWAKEFNEFDFIFSPTR